MKRNNSNPVTTVSRRIPALTMVMLLISIGVFLMTWGCSEEKSPDVKKVQSTEIDPQKLAGRWLRPDGGYILEISNIKIDGSLNAAYFNPNSINIVESKWRWHETRLQVYVKFDDINYTGSTYSLEYLSNQDRLIGNYYQAVMGQNFDVVFIRKE